MRHFIRHPAEIPIEVSSSEHASDLNHASCHSHNVGVGGLAFDSHCKLDPGAIVEVRIPYMQPAFETKARVAWCSELQEGFELGVEFLDPDDAFRARMVEQLCHIENYRNQISRTEGRDLTAEEAASEWIAKFAEHFPGSS